MRGMTGTESIQRSWEAEKVNYSCELAVFESANEFTAVCSSVLFERLELLVYFVIGTTEYVKLLSRLTVVEACTLHGFTWGTTILL
jgi:hypothetical protein